MDLPVMPPVAPMLAKPVGGLPEGPWSFEPKWDGFRTIVFRDGDEVELGSRRERPMTRYFPEVVEAVRANLPPRCVVDAEIVVPDADGRRLDFDALLLRIHPAASRVALLAEQTRPAWSLSTCSRWRRLTTWLSRSPAGGPPWSRPSAGWRRRSI
jgi:ATP-dependent DNA ligase